MEKEKKKRIRLVIADNMFTLLTSDNEEYSKQLAATLDSEIKELCRTCGKPVTISAILVALNSRDELQKLQTGTADLRRQLFSYLSEITEKDNLIKQLRAENRRLKTENALYRARLKPEPPLSNERPPFSKKRSS